MKTFTQKDAVSAAEEIGVHWEEELFDLDALWFGMNAEGGADLEGVSPRTDDPVIAARTALAHLRVRPDYYETLREAAEEDERFKG
ncbi:MAG TPA: DUF5661 family protein [Acidimicrobiia bacterium]|nr:DUF5661 family protein [Acidimicrobiia bacterium]